MCESVRVNNNLSQLEVYSAHYRKTANFKSRQICCCDVIESVGPSHLVKLDGYQKQQYCHLLTIKRTPLGKKEPGKHSRVRKLVTGTAC